MLLTSRAWSLSLLFPRISLIFLHTVLMKLSLLPPSPSQVLLGFYWNQIKFVWTKIERLYTLKCSIF